LRALSCTTSSIKCRNLRVSGVPPGRTQEPDIDPTANTQNRLRELFERALDVRVADRDAWIDAHAGSAVEGSALRRLLAADGGSGFLDTPATEHAARLAADEVTAEGLIGQRIGGFSLVRTLGRGGMAAVFLGERVGVDFEQQVAIKLLRRGLYSELEQRLFQRERQVLATLDHPNIARLIDGGVTDAGIPYLVMEHVDGVPITQYADDRAMDVRARLALFLAVCRTVEAAHRSLIVHRDIKPSNILVEADGTVKLLDFGIAKLIDEDDAGATIGVYTPEYAAPEQVSGGAITTATDVYGLAVLLHELLLGLRPQGNPTRRPSSRSAEAAAQADRAARAFEPALLRRQLRGDLDNILLKALDPKPGRRYASAGALADDIERHLEHRPVAAHPPSRVYRTLKFVQRHRGGVALTCLFVLGVLAALGAALWQAQVARHEAERANTVRDFVQGIFDPVRDGVAEGKLPSIRDLVATGADRLAADAQLEPAERIDLTLMFSHLMDDIGDRTRALDLATAASRLATQSLDRLDPLAIQVLEQRGSLAIHSGDYAAGEPALREARRRLQAAHIGGMPLVSVLDDLAVIEMDRDHGETVLDLEQQALDERVRTFGVDAREIAGGYNNLGYGLEGAGRFDEAAAAYQRAYEIDLKYRQPDSYDVLTGLSNWGWTLVRAGHLQHAAELLARAQADLDKIGGKPRFVNMLNAQKLCAVQTMLVDVAGADRACARMLAVSAQIAGEADATYADSLRLEAAHLLETGKLDEALAAAQRGWDLYGDSAESRSRRGALLRTRAEIEWLQGKTGAARDDALAARPMMAAVNDVPTLLSLDGLAVLACARAPAAACPTDLESTFDAKLHAAQASTHPRMLLARMALARRQLDRNDASAARATLDQGVAAAGAELANHPLLRSMQTWRVVALDSDHRCGDLVAARELAARPTRFDAYPWLVEANAALAGARGCSTAR
jgi:tetratricopeptide (TPR) repeat protein